MSYHIGLGRAYSDQRVIVLIAGTRIRVLTHDGHPLRQLTLNPHTDYQRQP